MNFNLKNYINLGKNPPKQSRVEVGVNTNPSLAKQCGEL